MAEEQTVTWDELERRVWEDTPLYGLMCRVVNGELSDWEIGYEEPSHVWRMTGNNAPWESEE